MSAQDAPSAAQKRQTLTDMLVTVSLTVMCLALLVRLYTDARSAGLIAAGCFLVFLVTGQKFFRLRERFLLTIAVALTVAATQLPVDLPALAERALNQSAFLAAFMILLALLRDGAATSDAVLGVGRYLTGQPPGRRYAAIAAGGHGLGVILNFGTLSLLGPLIQRGLREGAPESDRHLVEIRERRQISALARGFSWIIVWSPTAVTQALVPAVVSGAEQSRMAAMGAAVTVAVLFAGWLEDRLQGVRARAKLSAGGHRLPTGAATPFPKAEFGRFAAVCLSLAVLTIGVMQITGVKTIPALLLVAPVVTVCWVGLQNRHLADAAARTRARLVETLTVSVPRSSPEALTLAVAGYCGIMAAGLTDAETLAGLIRIDGTPPLVIYLVAAAIVPLASNAAMPPMFTVTFLGSLYSALPAPPGDPTLMGLAFSLGWALNRSASPFGATALVLARVTGIPATTLSWRWNGWFTLIAYAIVAAALALFSSL
jgi:hypothetical protein